MRWIEVVGPRVRRAAHVFLIALALAGSRSLVHTQAAQSSADAPLLPVLDVPFISQSELLCGGAAAAMVLRYWGERGLTAESFSHLVDRTSAGIRTTSLVRELQQRGWETTAIKGTDELLMREISRGRPSLILIEDRPRRFHYIVVVAATESSVVFHDPARAPFRVMPRREFSRRWEAADRWMAVVVPKDRPAPERSSGANAVEPIAAASSSCEQLVAEGVRRAQAQDLEGAERSLTSALSCPGSAALRELAGVRVLQRRWPDVSDLASAAVSTDPQDSHAWRLLATSRFIQSQPLAALEAWNRVGEPKLDLIRIEGATRTRSRVFEKAIGVAPGQLVTPAALVRARRRLSDVPSARTTRLDYVPVPSGLAEFRAVVAERSLFPSDPLDLATIGVAAAVTREVKLATGSISGGGERLGVEWRFWPGRPRVAVSVQAPAPGASVFGLGAFVEEQPFDVSALPVSKRRSARLSLSRWVAPWLRWSVRGGLDRWKDVDTFGALGGGLTLMSTDDRFSAQFDLDSWTGDQPFGVAHLLMRARSSTERQGHVFVGTLGAGLAHRSTPADQWFAGDTGTARPITLRAHPLVDDGRFRASRMGRTVVHGSVEAQRWWRVSIAQIGAAAFVDAAQLSRRYEPGSRNDLDVGVGARLSAPGGRGVLRIDVAKGLRDGATALSFVYESP